jgi:hypothetical protein
MLMLDGFSGKFFQNLLEFPPLHELVGLLLVAGFYVGINLKVLILQPRYSPSSVYWSINV